MITLDNIVLKQKCFKNVFNKIHQTPITYRFLVREQIWWDKNLLVFSKNVLKANKNFQFFRCNLHRNQTWVKNHVVKQKHKSIRFFSLSKLGSYRLFYVIRLLSAWVYWHSALLARQARTTSHHTRKKNYGSPTIARVYKIARELSHMHLFLPETEWTRCNRFLTNVLILYPLKAPENLWFFDAFRGHKMGTLARNGLRQILLTKVGM